MTKQSIVCSKLSSMFILNLGKIQFMVIFETLKKLISCLMNFIFYVHSTDAV